MKTWNMFRGKKDLLLWSFPIGTGGSRMESLPNTNRLGDWNRPRKNWDRKRDESFSAYLREHQEIPLALRTLARDYVEGFHAARPDQIGIKTLERSEESAEKTRGEKQFICRRDINRSSNELVKQLRKNVTSVPAEKAICGSVGKMNCFSPRSFRLIPPTFPMS